MTDLSLAESVALLAHAGEGFRRDPELLALGLAGALLADLAVTGRATVVNRTVAIADPSNTGDPLTDAALRRIEQDPRAREPRDWVLRLSKEARQTVLDRLTHRGLLRHERRRHVAVGDLASPLAGTVRDRVGDAIQEPADADPATVALCGLIEALGWARPSAPHLPAHLVDDRLAAFRRATWPATAVKALVDERRAGTWGPTVAATITANLDDWPRKPR